MVDDRTSTSHTEPSYSKEGDPPTALPAYRYRETLPAMGHGKTCPPTTAVHPKEEWVYRLVPSKDLTQECFDSHAKNGRPRPECVDACRWASCSVFSSDKTELNKLPKPKKMNFVAKFKINETAGRVIAGKSGHLDLWMYATFDPLQSCQIVAAISNG